MSPALPVSVVEMPEFLRIVLKLLDDDERGLLIDFLARNATAGDIIPETGGLRKLRWGLDGRGKRGGARVIYYFHNRNMPLFLLTAYAKNVRANLSQADKKAFRQLTGILIDHYKTGRVTS